MNAKVDRRIIKSQNAIQSAFLSMLTKDGFDEITVKEITEKADISRKTFYLHYVDKYDLLDTIVNRQLKELEKICDQTTNQDFVEGAVIWLGYFEQNKAFFSALFRSENTASFRKTLLNLLADLINKRIDKLSAGQDEEILLKFLSMAVFGIVESFVLDQLNGGTEKIAKELGELLLRNIPMASD